MKRFVTLAWCVPLLVVVLAATGLAQDGPSAALRQSVDQVLLVLKEPGYRDPALRPPLRAKIETLIHGIFDFSEFSARTVGRNWPSFTEDQKKRFDEAFAELLLTTYLDKVEGYNGEQVEYLGELLSRKGDKAEVRTTVTLADGKKVPVSYRMMLKNGKWVVYDVLIENVSLIKNYRSQFAEVLSKGTPEQLIERVKARVTALRAEASQS